MVGPSSCSSWQFYVGTIYLYMLGTTTTLSMLFQVLRLWLLVHLKERILFLGIAVTEININFEINQMHVTRVPLSIQTYDSVVKIHGMLLASSQFTWQRFRKTSMHCLNVV